MSDDLANASIALGLADQAIGCAVQRLTDLGGPDRQQVFAYDLAHAAAGAATAKAMLPYGELGEVEARLTCGFVADAIHDLVSKLIGREQLWGVDPALLAPAHDFIAAHRHPEFLASLARTPGARHLGVEMEMVQDSFRAFAEDVITPQAEHVHRGNGDVPEQIISGLAELGAFGLSVPADYGGFSEGGDDEYLAMVVATEELSRASLGIGGSLITRPEILTRALVKGGT